MKDLIHVVSGQEAAKLFAGGLGDGVAAAGSPQLQQQDAVGGQWRFRMVELVVGLQPFLLSNYWHSMDGEGWPGGREAADLLAGRPAVGNCATKPLSYGGRREQPPPHTRMHAHLADASNAFFRLCKYLGRCTYNDPRAAAVLLFSAE